MARKVKGPASVGALDRAAENKSADSPQPTPPPAVQQARSNRLHRRLYRLLAEHGCCDSVIVTGADRNEKYLVSKVRQ